MRNHSGAVEFLGSFTEDLPDPGLPEVAFAGRSNVGKSSALNRLLGSKKAARVSGRPGRTQAINLFQVGRAVVFADLPGYGYARVPDAVRVEWGAMIDRYLAMRERLRLVVLLVDCRREAQEMDAQLIDALLEMKIQTIVLATKIDKLTRNERLKQLASLAEGLSLPEEAMIPFSSVSGEGRDETWARIEAICR
jgi:GTP-binding protein